MNKAFRTFDQHSLELLQVPLRRTICIESQLSPLESNRDKTTLRNGNYLRYNFERIVVITRQPEKRTFFIMGVTANPLVLQDLKNWIHVFLSVPFKWVPGTHQARDFGGGTH